MYKKHGKVVGRGAWGLLVKAKKHPPFLPIIENYQKSRLSSPIIRSKPRVKTFIGQHMKSKYERQKKFVNASIMTKRENEKLRQVFK